MELVLFIGIQASGKSSFFKQRFSDSHVRINLDMLKTKRREEILIDACLKAKQKLVVDKTNLTINERREHISNAKGYGFKVIGYYFQTNLTLALERNRLRDGVAKVPDVAILGSNRSLELPSYDEGFDELFYVNTENGAFGVEGWKDEV